MVVIMDVDDAVHAPADAMTGCSSGSAVPETDGNRPRRLSAWIRGTGRLHFTGGAAVAMNLSQAEARELNALVRAERESDRLAWSSLSWIAVRSSQVVLFEFRVAPDLGWPMTARHREQLRTNGFEHGPLEALRQMWLHQPEPAFSQNALQLLHASACTDPSGMFDDLAAALEGEAGAVYARRILDDSDDPSLDIDDARRSPESDNDE